MKQRTRPIPKRFDPSGVPRPKVHNHKPNPHRLTPQRVAAYCANARARGSDPLLDMKMSGVLTNSNLQLAARLVAYFMS